MTTPEQLLDLSNVAGGLATMAHGQQKKRLEKTSSEYLKLAFDAKFGPSNIGENLSDDELLNELSQ